jgi:glucose uptake protein GlcU
MNGSFMAPLELASRHVSSLQYFVSFGFGSMLISAGLLVLANLVWWLQGKPLAALHCQTVGPPALLTGLMWTGGYLASIKATEALGMAVAYPVIQAQLVVSSLWGILYYREVTTRASMYLLLLCTVSLAAGISVLSQSASR